MESEKLDLNFCSDTYSLMVLDKILVPLSVSSFVKQLSVPFIQGGWKD